MVQLGNVCRPLCHVYGCSYHYRNTSVRFRSLIRQYEKVINCCCLSLIVRPYLKSKVLFGSQCFCPLIVSLRDSVPGINFVLNRCNAESCSASESLFVRQHTAHSPKCCFDFRGGVKFGPALCLFRLESLKCTFKLIRFF